MNRSKETVSATRLTVQCAVEHIVNAPGGFDTETIRVVLADAENAGVGDLYLGELRKILGEVGR